MKLHYYNATRRIPLLVKNFRKGNIVMIPHPLFSPGIPACDFSLFTKVIKNMEEQHYAIVENIK